MYDTNNQKPQYWLVKLGGVVRGPYDKGVAAHAARQAFGDTSPRTLVKPMGTRLSEIRRAGAIAKAANDPQGWQLLDMEDMQLPIDRLTRSRLSVVDGEVYDPREDR
jgi:hypothetical protein